MWVLSLPAPLGDKGQRSLFIPMGEVSASQESYCYVLTAGLGVLTSVEATHSSVSRIMWCATVDFYHPSQKERPVDCSHGVERMDGRLTSSSLRDIGGFDRTKARNTG